MGILNKLFGISRQVTLSDSKLKKFMENGHIINDSGYGIYISLDKKVWYKQFIGNKYIAFNVDKLPSRLQNLLSIE